MQKEAEALQQVPQGEQQLHQEEQNHQAGPQTQENRPPLGSPPARWTKELLVPLSMHLLLSTQFPLSI